MKIVSTDLAPKAIGTYSQAVKSGAWVFLSGQIPLDPNTMLLVEGDIKQSIIQVFENVSAVCSAASGSLANIVKLNVYLTDLSHFDVVNQVMAQYFTEPYPARAAIQVSALPKGAEVEMDGIMILDN